MYLLYHHIIEIHLRQKPVKTGNKKTPKNQGFRGSDFSASKTVDCGYVMECCVASTIEHNRFSIVWVCQASEDIQFPYISLIWGVIQLAVLYNSLIFLAIQ